MDDDDARNPSRSYGAGKVRCERYLMAEHAANGFPAVSLRVGHTLGPHSPLPREHAFFAKLEAGRPIPVPGDGLPFVHLVHVDDVAQCMALAVEQAVSAGQIYNVNSAEFASIGGYLRLMAEVVGVEADLRFVPREVAKTIRPPILHWAEWYRGGAVFSIDKARHELSYAPRFGLRAGLEDAYRWFQSEGRATYAIDFGRDEALLTELDR